MGFIIQVACLEWPILNAEFANIINLNLITHKLFQRRSDSSEYNCTTERVKNTGTLVHLNLIT